MTRPSAPSEVELKLTLWPGDSHLLAQSDGWALEPVQRLTSTYFDTPDGALRKRGFSLRLRAGTQTLKAANSSAAGLFDRGEWEWPVEGTSINLSALSNTPVGDMDQIAPQFQIQVQRRTGVLAWGASRIEMALDLGQVVTIPPTVPLAPWAQTFCELELELLSGSARDLYGLASHLGQSVSLWPATLSKADRGFQALSQTGLDPVKADSRADLAGLSVKGALAAALREGLGQILKNSEVLTESRNPEALHQMRVALRRLRSTLGLYRHLKNDPTLGPLRGQLRTLAQTLGHARDLDVLLGRLPTTPRLTEALMQEREAVYDAVLLSLRRPTFGQVMLGLSAWIETGDWREPDHPLAEVWAGPARPFADEALERRRRKFKKQGRDIVRMTVPEQHRTRILAKRLRYAMEGFASLYPQEASNRKRLVEAVKRVQDLLGAMNDRVLGEALLRPYAQGPTAFEAGEALATLYRPDPEAPERVEQAIKAALDLPRFWPKP
jgi:inorganic triphosphatase YgiF